MKGGIVKICGLNDPDNIRRILNIRPDWIGCIFYEPSPRCIRHPKKLAFLNEIDSPAKKVGVFVNSSFDEIMNLSQDIRLDGIQLHGKETPELCKKIHNRGFFVIKAFGVGPEFDFKTTNQYSDVADYFLFDTGSPAYGGTGGQFDWTLLKKYDGKTPFILSGGLSAETQILPDHPQFAGVDLNSRFEISPGIKNTEPLQKFINQFRNE